MIGSIIAKVIGKVVGEGAGNQAIDYFAKKQQLKYKLKLAKIEGQIGLAAAKLKAQAEWAAANIANSGWKDEWVLLLLSIPLVLAFIPGTVQYVHDGFAALEKTPAWYRWLIGSIMAAIYGIKPAWEFWKGKANGS